MHLDQMYPKRYLDAQDLMALHPRGAVVTIDDVDVTWHKDDKGEPEAVYMLYTMQFKKPFRLNRSKASIIADQLGSKNTEDWRGGMIRIVPFKKRINDRNTGRPIDIWFIEVDLEEPKGLTPLPATRADITGAADQQAQQLKAAGAAGQLPPGAGVDITTAAALLDPIQIDKAVEIVAAFHERGKSVEDFARHLSLAKLEHMIAARVPPTWPKAVLNHARSFIKGLPRTTAALTAQAIEQLKADWAKAESKAGAVVDPVTGAEVISEDDIPF